MIDRDDVRRLVAQEGAQHVEVLPSDSHEGAHLPGAISIPLKKLDVESTHVLDRTGPVIVYCYNSQ